MIPNGDEDGYSLNDVIDCPFSSYVWQRNVGTPVEDDPGDLRVEVGGDITEESPPTGRKCRSPRRAADWSATIAVVTFVPSS